MTKILALCHGKINDNLPGSSCETQFIDITNATFLDKNNSCKPHILQDLKKPFSTKIKYNIITTVCCDSDVFYNDRNKSIEPQTFKNIKFALAKNGLFIIPKYYWINNKNLQDIQSYLTFIKKIKTEYETYYFFQKL